jgi:hypothetical protein
MRSARIDHIAAAEWFRQYDLVRTPSPAPLSKSISVHISKISKIAKFGCEML